MCIHSKDRILNLLNFRKVAISQAGGRNRGMKTTHWYETDLVHTGFRDSTHTYPSAEGLNGLLDELKQAELELFRRAATEMTSIKRIKTTVQMEFYSE